MRVRRTPILLSMFLGFVVGGGLYLWNRTLDSSSNTSEAAIIVIAATHVKQGEVLKRSMVSMKSVPTRYVRTDMMRDVELGTYLGARAGEDVEPGEFLLKYNFQR